MILSAAVPALAEDAPAPSGAVGIVWLTIALPLLGFVVNGLLAILRPKAKRAVSAVGAGVLLAAFGVAAAVFLQLWNAPPEVPYHVYLWHWLNVGTLHVDFALQVDQLSTVMLLVITGVGSLIHLFSVGYMHDDPGYARYFAYLNLFIVFMLILTLGSSFPVMFIGWEGVGLCSYLLIGFWFTAKENADAGKKAFLVNRVGDFGFLVAMFLIWHTVGSLEFTTVLQEAPAVLTAGMATWICLFLLLGCTGKSAQIPLYIWLPDAMAGPTPVSALIHAATMVTAGVYLIARTSVLFALSPEASTVTAAIGAATALLAAIIGLRQYDIKKVLAYSTVSQLGYMFVGVGAGAYSSGIFHLVTHAFFKALLFLGSGSVIHAMHHAYHATHSHDDAQDMRNMGGLRAYLPATYWLMLVGTLAIAGIPPLSGFFSKDSILAAAFARGREDPIWYLFYAMGLTAALLTAFYMARLIAMTFLGPNRTGAAERDKLHEAPAIMTGPLVVLGILSIVGGGLNLPAFAGGRDRLDHWLEPVVGNALRLRPLEPLHGQTELLLIGAAVLVGVLGLAAGFRATLAGTILPARQAPAEHGLARVVYRKFYVDEIYDALVVRPVVWIADRVLWRTVDQAIVDGTAVTGTVRASQAVGWLGSRLQNGQLGFYAVLFVLGAVWVLQVILG